ncbi:MAG: SOS response-associated peptidase [bacterium]|jgi:putative SOS response-associated peptidase YedK
MCGRYTLVTDLKLLAEHFGFAADEMRAAGADNVRPRYNIAPSQDAAVVIAPADSQKPALPGDEMTVLVGPERRLVMMRWGLVPAWAKDEKIGDKMINARAETVAEKPSFKNALKSRRCLIPADGFYEWTQTSYGRKAPIRFTMKDGRPFAMAGLYETWKRPEGDVLFSFTIITTEANEVLRPYHHRMPVIIPPERYALWLDTNVTDTEKLQKMLLPYPADEMRGYKVSSAVNSPRNDVPECIEEKPDERGDGRA